MASPLLSNPTDILLSIFAPLPPTTLRELCLVNTDLRALAEPFLYSSIHWTWVESQTPPITSLLRTILQRPQLVIFVQSITLDRATFKRDRHQFRLESPKLVVSEDDLGALIDCINSINVPFGEVWIQEIRSGTMDAFVALLLSRLPRLRRLRLGENFTRESRLVGMMLRSTLCEQLADGRLPSFEYLKDASAVYFPLGIDILSYTDARNTADVLPIFYLPSVEHITASIDNPDTFMWPTRQPPSLLRLVSVDLTMIREEHLGQVLSATSRLQKLQWDWYYRPDSNLGVLKNLEVPLPFLLEFSPSGSGVMRLEERLPPSIEFLTITDDLYLQEEWEWWDVDLLQVLIVWLQDWRSCTPHLRGFHLFLKMMDYEEWGPTMRQELKDLSTQAGIRVEITKLAGNI